MTKLLNVLIVEDSEVDALLILGHLKHGGYETRSRLVDNARDLSAALNAQKWDVVLSDHNMPGFSSGDALCLVREVDRDVPFLIISGSIGEEEAVSSMRSGAQDYLMKGHLTHLVAAVERELQDAEDRRARKAAERSLLIREDEMRIAREIQQQLIPASVPVHSDYDMAGASCPAEATGGDYFDFIAGPKGAIYVVVGDVTGHGLGPALLMADVRAYLRALVLSNRNLEEIMVQARHLLVEDLGTERFITLLFAKLTTACGHLDFINAGHPTGYVVAADGTLRGELEAMAPALGIDGENERLAPGRVVLGKGDLVLLLTDGILEATSPEGEEFGAARVLELVRRERARPAAEIIRLLFEKVRQFKGPDSFQDDITALVVKRLHHAAER